MIPHVFRLFVTILFVVLFGWAPFAGATVANNGRLLYGDATNLGVLKFQTLTNPFTFNGEISTGLSTTASAIAYIVAKASPNREEILIGHLKVDGRLDVIRGVNGSDAAADFSLQWNNPGTTPAMTCTGTAPADCTRAFDLEYEQLSGRAMVIYADNVNQKLYYCIWDGSAWSPLSTCAPTNGTNDITLSSNGRPTFVSMKAKPNSNEILVGVSVDIAGGHEVEAFRWTGSTFTDFVVATDVTKGSTQALKKGNNFDVAWETNSGDALIVWGTTTGGATRYKLLPSGGTWGSEQTGPALVGGDGVVVGVNLDRDPASNRIAFASNDSVSDGNFGIWKANGSTAGWTMGNEDPSLESQTTGPPYTDVIWQNRGSVAIWFAQNVSGIADPEDERATCTGAGCTFTALDVTIPTGGATDDGTFTRLSRSPNNNDIMALYGDIDRTLVAQRWNGSAWQSSNSGVLEADVSGAGADTTIYHNLPATFLYIPYAPWSRNWRWYADNDATTPTSALAGENIAPATVSGDQVRLRLQIAEEGGQGQTGGAETKRKKLQYTTGNPNSLSTTWTDVAATGTDWIYADCTGCTDDATVPSTLLTGSTAAGPFVETTSTTSSYNHAALAIAEWDYVIQDNVAAANRGMTYYFRAYDTEQSTSVLRRQRPGDTFTYSEICPKDTTISATAGEWCFDTDVASLAAPAMDPGVRGYIANQSGDIWALDLTTGAQPIGWTNFTDPNAEVQARLAVIDESPSPKAIYLGSLDGCLYKVNATDGAQIWWSGTATFTGGTLPCDAESERIADQVIASPALQTIGATTTVYVATRNTSNANTTLGDANNMIWALTTAGVCNWVFNGTCARGTGASNIGVISNMPTIDWDNNCLYFTSRETAAADSTVWAIRTASGGCGSAGAAGSLAWSLDTLAGTNIGAVDAGALSANNCTLYVGDNTGRLWAINTGSGITGCTGTAGTAKWTGAGYFDADGASNGIFAESIWVEGTALYFSLSSGSVYRVNDPGAGAAPPGVATGWPATGTAVSGASFPVSFGLGGLGRNFVYVGSSDGRLHQLTRDTGADTPRPVESAATVGSPTLDVQSCTGSPVVCKIYVSTSSGKLYAIEAPY